MKLITKERTVLASVIIDYRLSHGRSRSKLFIRRRKVKETEKEKQTWKIGSFSCSIHSPNEKMNSWHQNLNL